RIRPLPRSTLFPYTTLFRSHDGVDSGLPKSRDGGSRAAPHRVGDGEETAEGQAGHRFRVVPIGGVGVGTECPFGHSQHPVPRAGDRKSTRLNSSHVKISYAV